MHELKFLNKYFLKYKYRLLLGIIAVAASNIFFLGRGVYVKKATDELCKNILANSVGDASTYLKFTLIFLGLSIAGGIFMFLMRQFIIVVSRLIEYDLKNEIYAHYQKLDSDFYKKNHTGDLMNRISEDVGKVRMFTGPVIMYLVNTFVTVTTVIIFMCQESVELTLWVIAPLPVLSFIIFKVSNAINKKSTLVQQELSVLTGKTQESFSGVRAIKSFGREFYFTNSFNESSKKYKNLSLNLTRTEALFQPFMVLMVGLSLVSIVYFGGKLYIQDKISIGNFPQFVFYVFNLTWPFASLGWISSLTQRAAASQKRINEFLATKPQIVNSNNEPIEYKGEIEFNNVTYTYPESGIVALKNLSFKINKGETIGIIGTTGSGKTTLLNLLLRYIENEKGSINIDNQDIKKINLNAFRQQTGTVNQDVFLFSDTVKNNIAFGLENKLNNDEIVFDAAKKADVYNNIMQFENKFETMIGERGVTLSGGQKQRISIARALIKKPKILLLDDCLSALDNKTEENILNALQTEFKNRTTIIASHRISALKHCNKIMVLDKGELIEFGTKDELLAKGGYYAQIEEMQKVEFAD